MDPDCACLINCDLFGRHAGYFESEIVPKWQWLYDSIVSRSKIANGSMVLDAGTGTGEVALRLASAVGPGGRAVGVDEQDEMLKIARKKMLARGVTNLEFKKTSLEGMDLPDGSFDSIVANYSLCCCFDYRGALEESFRVLKPGGRLTYNHNGPTDPLIPQLAFTIFEKYKTSRPSDRLSALRESDAAQVEGFEKYRDPLVAVSLLRASGFKEVEATITERRSSYKDPAEYLDRLLAFDCRSEAEEISAPDVERFRSEATSALAPLSTGPSFTILDETVYFTGVKP
jgi:ubiquinone/menaquinone biosynthesis C-methylase UbiE